MFFLSLYMFGFKQYTAGIMGKETRDQSGNSGTNAYEIPVELVCTYIGKSRIPAIEKSMMKANAPTQRILL